MASAGMVTMNRTKLAIGLGVIVALLIGVRVFLMLGTPKEVDPRTRIQQMFAQGKQAFENEDIEGMLDLISDDFHWGGMNKQQLRYQLAQFFKQSDAPRAELGELQIEIFAGRILVRTTVRATWRDSNAPGGTTSQDLGVVEFEFRKFPQRKWLIIPYEDWQLVRIDAPQMGEIPL
ncbi:MAG: nuclear transport factor 2 family protein [Fimbriimonadales bacterium]|nr:nuclear transport factor 2 family protein [Fimbriimonadales bacterium]